MGYGDIAFFGKFMVVWYKLERGKAPIGFVLPQGDGVGRLDTRYLHGDRRSDSAPLNSAPISTQPATDFHVGISTPEFRRDDATLKYDVTLRQLSLSSCPNPIRAISCLDHRSSALLKFVSRGVGILLRWWRSFNRVGWEYRQPLR
jgi:hypothetical protein